MVHLNSRVRAVGTRAHWALARRLPLTTRRHYLHLSATGRWGDFERPQTYQEKLNARILYDRRDVIVRACDKLAMKEMARAAVPDAGDLLIPETLWAGRTFVELAPDAVFDDAVAKPNNGCGDVVAGTLTRERLLEAEKEWRSAIPSAALGEWGYTRVQPLNLIERRIASAGRFPDDFKFFVFDGRVRWVQVNHGRFSEEATHTHYTREWEKMDFHRRGRPSGDIPRPANLERMVSVAERLAAGWDHIRVDLYTDGTSIWFGEFTPYPNGGCGRFDPRSFDRRAGAWWTDVATLTPPERGVRA